MEKKLIGRCGLYCGECEIRTAYISGDEKLIAEVAEKLGTRPDEVRCECCLELTEKCWGHGCEIIACIESRGFKHCVQCPDIDDCTKFARLNTKYGGAVRLNIRQIRSWGFERWVAFKEGEETEEENKTVRGTRHLGGQPERKSSK
jgi:hypothetical protein